MALGFIVWNRSKHSLSLLLVLLASTIPVDGSGSRTSAFANGRPGQRPIHKALRRVGSDRRMKPKEGSRRLINFSQRLRNHKEDQTKASVKDELSVPRTKSRQMVLRSLAAVSMTPLAVGGFSQIPANAQQENWKKLSNAEWKNRLTPEQYFILRERGTERPFSSPLVREKRKGTFCCAGCEIPLFESSKKFDSGTGWPSFYDALEGVQVNGGGLAALVGLSGEELSCRSCGGHLGDRFNDGILWSTPTGLRYCIDGYALDFKPEGAASS